MFPDPALRWAPVPTVMDGMKRPPSVVNRGASRGVLSLLVIEAYPGARAYGVQIAVETYAAYDEALYSLAEHGHGAAYDGGVYVKEATSSALLAAYERIMPWEAGRRHLLFVGGEYCFEVLGEKPVIRVFADPDEAYAWRPDVDATTAGSTAER